MAAPGKKAPAVKVDIKQEPASSSRIKLEPSDGSVESQASDNEKWQEIPLKACTPKELEDTRYHILKFQSKQDVDIINNFNRPVRLHRKDPRNIQFQLTRKEVDARKREQEEHELEKERLRAQGIVPLDDSDTPDMSQVAPDGGARRHRRSAFKRKTKQINLMDEKKRRLRYEEYYPWVIEDYDGLNVFVGNYEAGLLESQHVLFVFDKDGFKMVPAEKVYRFTPRNKYATLTLEEAEAKMEKNASAPRWLMKHMEEGSTAEGATPDVRFKRNTARGIKPGSITGSAAGGGSRGLRTVLGGAATLDRDSDHDDIDFDEEFADDEEAPIMDGDEEENKELEKKIKKEMLKASHFDGQSDADADDSDDLNDLFETEKTRKVDKEGKKLRKVLLKTEGGVYDSDDNDDKLNPYLLKLDLESDDDSDDNLAVKQENDENGNLLTGASRLSGRAFTAQSNGDGFVVIKAPSLFLSGFQPGEWNPHVKKRAMVEASPVKTEIANKEGRNISPSPTPGVDLNASGTDGQLVTVAEVLGIVKNNPLTTKELLFGLKNRVNMHKDNKQRIISIVKQNLKLVDGKLVLKEDA